MRAKRVAVLVSILLCGAGVAVGQTVWEHDPNNPIIVPGPPGSWDAGGHGAATALFDGLVYHMWFTGWDGAGNNWDIGHATSPDGLPPWTMDPNPVLTRGAPGEWDGDSIFSPAVIFDGGLFHMWYSGWHNNRERVGYATSPDGGVWTKYFDNPVMDVGPPGSWNDWIVRPGAVILDDGVLKMWFSAFDTTPIGRIGYAESLDGIAWTVRQDGVLAGGGPGAWDLDVVNPSVVFDGQIYHMWYVGMDALPEQEHRIGYAFSGDGTHWTKHRGNPVVQTADEFAFLAPVIFDGSTYHMWYSHGFPPGSSISYATSTCCAGLFGDQFETGDTSLWSLAVP